MKPIPRYEKYLVSECGTVVKNSTTGQNIKQSAVNGYMYVSLYLDYKIYRVCVHRLVAFAYLPPPQAGQVWVNHKDGNKANNSADNLEWTTISENIKHAYRTGLKRVFRGKDHWMTGAKVGQVTRNRMSRAKVGSKHPKFKGYYTHRGNRYESLRQANLSTKIDKRKILRMCKAAKNGWGFEPVAHPPANTQKI